MSKISQIYTYKTHFSVAEQSFPWTEWTDSQKCVVELLLSLIDELAGLTLTCSRQILSQLLTGLATFVGSLRESQLGKCVI
jgi:hypothetical protein